MSCLVDYSEKLSNLFEDLKKLDDFAQSIENQLIKDKDWKMVVKKKK